MKRLARPSVDLHPLKPFHQLDAMIPAAHAASLDLDANIPLVLWEFARSLAVAASWPQGWPAETPFGASRRIILRRPTPFSSIWCCSLESHWSKLVIGFLALQTSDSLGQARPPSLVSLRGQFKHVCSAAALLQLRMMTAVRRSTGVELPYTLLIVRISSKFQLAGGRSASKSRP